MAGVGRRSCCAGPAAALWGLPPKARGAVEFRTAHSARSARHCAAPTLAPAGAVCLFWFAPRLRWSPPVAHHVVSCWASPPALTDSGATGSLRPAGPGGLRLPVAPARVSGLTWKEEGRRRRRRVGDGARQGGHASCLVLRSAEFAAARTPSNWSKKFTAAQDPPAAAGTIKTRAAGRAGHLLLHTRATHARLLGSERASVKSSKGPPR